MEALIWEAPSHMAVRTIDDPEPGIGEVAVRVAYAGICGSELGGFLGHNALRVPPLVMGHEFAGTITALGQETGDRLAVGQAVTCNPMIACGTCEYCRGGLPHLCLNRSLVGAHRPGAFAETVIVPQSTLHPLPAGMALRSGALVEPVAVAMRIGKIACPLQGKSAVIIGAGPIGLLALQVFLRLGAASVHVSDIERERLAMAGELGARTIDPRSQDIVGLIREQTGGSGVHLAVDAVGSEETRRQAVAVTRSGGRVILSGLHEEESTFPAADIIRREIEVHGAFCYDSEDFAKAIDAIDSNEVRLDPWIVEAPMAEGERWFKTLIEKPGPVSKVLLVP